MHQRSKLGLTSLALACLFHPGCAQLVAFEQTVVGAPDVAETSSTPGGGLCDPEVAMGRSAGCDESCLIEADDPDFACPRVTLNGNRARVNLTGLHEVEVALTACASEGSALRILGPNGASVSVEGQELELRAAEEAQAQPVRQPDFLPEGECEDRALIIQTGRMELAHTGTRMCSAHLLPVEGEWELELGPALRGVELCFRQPPAPAGT